MNLVHALYEPAGEGPFPTIFAMHGWGSNAFDLHGIAPFIAAGRFLVLCPQGPHDVQIGAISGYGWYDTKPGAKPDEEKVDAAIAGLRTFINDASGRYPVDRNRIVLVGFSQGGMMAYNLAMRWPDKFAALVPRKAAELFESDAVGRGSPVGLHAPAQIRTAPRGEAVSARQPPEQADRAHRELLLAARSVLSGVA